MATNNVTAVTDVYRNVLGREPDAEGLAYWTSQLTSGKLSSSNLTSTIANAAATYKPTGNETVSTQDIASSMTNAALYLGTGQTISERAATTAAKDLQISQLESEVQAANEALQIQLAESAKASADMYKDFSSQMAVVTAEMNSPKEVSSKVQGLGNVQGGGKTLAEADLDARRGNVDKAYLGARKLQIPLANKGATKNEVSALNVGTTKGLQI